LDSDHDAVSTEVAANEGAREVPQEPDWAVSLVPGDGVIPLVPPDAVIGTRLAPRDRERM
jgi:hypothetical protein